MSHLTTLLEYHLRSKEVATFKDVSQLLISDKVKVQLPEHVLSHVIKSELAALNSWLNVAALSDVLNMFAATHSVQGYLKYIALGAQPMRNSRNYCRQNNFQQPVADDNISLQ